MTDQVLQFYNQLADDYLLIFADWKQSVQRQAGVLDGLIREQRGGPPLTALDCTCGVGTQAIGLAGKGYTVHATDLSPAAVEKARTYAGEFGVSLTLGVADIRRLDTQVAGTFDVVLSCDNAVSHLVDDADLLLATRQMAAKLNDNGLLLVSIRDYDQTVQLKPRSTLPVVNDTAQGRQIVFQIWDWLSDGRAYDLSMFTLRQAGIDWETTCLKTRLRALLRDELTVILNEAGLVDVRWYMPDTTGFHQPIVTAHKR